MARHDPELERKYGLGGRLVRIIITDGAELYTFSRGMKGQAQLVAISNVNGSRNRRFAMEAPQRVVEQAQAEFDQPVNTGDLFGHTVKTEPDKDKPEILWCNGITVAIWLPDRGEVRLREDRIAGRKDITPEVIRLAMAVITTQRRCQNRKQAADAQQGRLFTSEGADKHH